MSLLNDDQIPGLNDETLSELKPTEPNLDAVLPSSEGSKPDAVVVLDEPLKTTDEEAARFIDTMGDYDVTLKTVEDGVSRAHSLRDVETLVLSAESMGQSMAEVVARTLPELQERVAPLNRFTELPTKTYLDKTKDFVETSVKSEREQLSDRLSAFIARELKAATALYGHLKAHSLDTAIEELEALRKQATLDLAEASVSKSFLRYRFDDKGNPIGELLDLRRLPITQYLSENIPNLPETFPSRVMGDALYSAVSQFDLRSIVNSSQLSMNLTRLVESFITYGGPSGDENRLERKPVSYLDLLTYLASNQVGTVLQDIASATAQVVDTVHVNGRIDQDTSALVAEILTSLNIETTGKLDALEAFVKELRSMMGLVMVLFRFTTAVNQFVPIANEVLNGYRAVMKTT